MNKLKGNYTMSTRNEMKNSRNTTKGKKKEQAYFRGHLLSVPTTEFFDCCRNLADEELSDCDLVEALAFVFGYISDEYEVQEEVALEALNHLGLSIKEDAVGNNIFVEEYTRVPVRPISLYYTILPMWASRFLTLCEELTTETLTQQDQFALLERAYTYGYEKNIKRINYVTAASEYFDYAEIEYEK